MHDVAEIMSKDGELKAQHGEPAYRPHFHQYLEQRGVDENTWAHAWNGWWTRMESDPSGQLHARFATIQQQLTMQAHFADVPDASQEAKEGVTLDAYARIMATSQQPGQDMQQLAAQEGLDWEQWQAAQAAWNAAMAADTDHHLTTQYGQLYAKYTPGFQEQMEQQTAALMAQNYEERAAGEEDEEEPDYTFEDALAELDNKKPSTRWTAAHHLANFWDVGDREEEPRLEEALKAIPVMIECLERHDEFTASDAEALAGDLCMFAEQGALTREQADDAKGAMQRCLGRARERLQTLRAAFAPIADKAVPERVKMQAQIQDYTSLVDELAEKVADWDDNLTFNDNGSEGASVAMVPAGPTAPATQSESGGFLAVLKRIPIIGAILRLLGL
jgi:hypothetical protein